jgi:replicative DNA helicase
MASADISLERTMPNSMESERAVLGAVLLDENAIFAAAEILTPDDFYLEAHRAIFRAMLALAEEKISINFFTLREELRRCDKEELASGTAYIAGLTDGLPRCTNTAHYARQVRGKATSRQLIQLSHELMSHCYEGEEHPAAILEQAESQIFRIASREIRGGFEPTSELAHVAYKEIWETARNHEPVSGIDTGFADLNRMTGGLHNQNLVIVAARPGLGKTSFCLNIACHAAINGRRPVGIFSLEMSKPEIMKRMISSLSGVDANRIQSGYLNRNDWMNISQATASLSSAPIHIDDSANLTMLQVRAKA